MSGVTPMNAPAANTEAPTGTLSTGTACGFGLYMAAQPLASASTTLRTSTTTSIALRSTIIPRPFAGPHSTTPFGMDATAYRAPA